MPMMKMFVDHKSDFNGDSFPSTDLICHISISRFLSNFFISVLRFCTFFSQFVIVFRKSAKELCITIWLTNFACKKSRRLCKISFGYVRTSSFVQKFVQSNKLHITKVTFCPKVFSTFNGILSKIVSKNSILNFLDTILPLSLLQMFR